MSNTCDHNPPDVYHDEKQRSEVGQILRGLPVDHPARVAYQLGKGPIAISHLLNDRALLQRITVAFVDGLKRSLRPATDTAEPGPRFLDKEEWVAIKLIVEELDPAHPIRMAFSQGADTMALLRLTADGELRTRLRAVRIEALDRQVQKSKPRKA